MTNEELLQQAKDQVAGDYLNAEGFPCQKWSELPAKYYAEAVTIAALLAIQSAREEGKKEGYKIACRNNGIEEDPSGPYAMGPGM